MPCSNRSFKNWSTWLFHQPPPRARSTHYRHCTSSKAVNDLRHLVSEKKQTKASSRPNMSSGTLETNGVRIAVEGCVCSLSPLQP